METKTIYTPEVITAMRAASPLNLDKCQELADRFNKGTKDEPYSTQGFITKSRTLDGVEYERKARNVTKNGDPVVSKRDLVQGLESTLGLSEGSLESLVKANKADIQTLVSAMPNMVDA